LNWYYSKGSGNGRKQIIFLKLVHQMEYSHPFISGVSVTVAHRTFQFEGGGQHLLPLNSNLMRLVLTGA
jgi:hypothetical protein